MDWTICAHFVSAMSKPFLLKRHCSGFMNLGEGTGNRLQINPPQFLEFGDHTRVFRRDRTLKDKRALCRKVKEKRILAGRNIHDCVGAWGRGAGTGKER